MLVENVASLPVIETDVLVCGGGCAGVGAALASARSGARTFLVERAGFTGGVLTAIGNPWFDGIAELDTGRIVLRGLPFEILCRLGLARAGDDHLAHAFPPVDPERFKRVVDALLVEQSDRLRVLYHTIACEVVGRSGRIEGVVVANKAGLTLIRPKVTIDATGDADIAWKAGAPVVKEEPLQPMTLHFRVGNVRREPELVPRMRETVLRLKREGVIELYFFHDDHDDFAHAPDELVFNMTRIPGDATDPDVMSQAEIIGRRDAWVLFDAWKREVPGFRDAYFITSGPYCGVRETRRIVGDYQLTEDDIRQRRSFDDVVLQGCFYIDVHPSDSSGNHQYSEWTPRAYDIPFSTLIPRGWDDLLAPGRCHSATRRAVGSSRVTATAMGMGQAAGTAAALAVQRAVSVRDVPISSLQAALEKQDVLFGDADAPSGRGPISPR